MIWFRNSVASTGYATGRVDAVELDALTVTGFKDPPETRFDGQIVIEGKGSHRRDASGRSLMVRRPWLFA
jgi:hypothetical protein